MEANRITLWVWRPWFDPARWCLSNGPWLLIVTVSEQVVTTPLCKTHSEGRKGWHPETAEPSADVTYYHSRQVTDTHGPQGRGGPHQACSGSAAWYLIYPPHSLRGTYSVLSVSLPHCRKPTNEDIFNSVKGLKSKAERCSSCMPDGDLILKHSKSKPCRAGLPAPPNAEAKLTAEGVQGRVLRRLLTW